MFSDITPSEAAATKRWAAGMLAIVAGCVASLIAILTLGLEPGLEPRDISTLVFATVAAAALFSAAIIAMWGGKLRYLQIVWGLLLGSCFFGPGGMMQGGVFVFMALMYFLLGLVTAFWAQDRN